MGLPRGEPGSPTTFAALPEVEASRDGRRRDGDKPSPDCRRALAGDESPSRPPTALAGSAKHVGDRRHLFAAPETSHPLAET
jgi:hypothetical protein